MLQDKRISPVHERKIADGKIAGGEVEFLKAATNIDRRREYHGRATCKAKGCSDRRFLRSAGRRIAVRRRAAAAVIAASKLARWPRLLR
ncbi:hypothetical protein ACVIIW_002553 [Bradyrhizobium sp. USDA 4449]